MPRKLIATVAAAAIAVTGFAASPAKADTSAVEFLAGATALIIIGKAIADSSQKQHHPHVHASHVRRTIGTTLPRACVYGYQKRYRVVRMLSSACLQNNYTNVNALPGVCSRKVRTINGRVHYGFRMRCLRDRGYRIVY